MTYKELAQKYYEATGKRIALSTICYRANELNRLPTVEELKPRKAGRHPKFEK